MSTLWLRVVDSDYAPVTGARVHLVADSRRPLDVRSDDDGIKADVTEGTRVAITITAEGFEPESHSVSLAGEVMQVVMGLRRAGQLAYTFGDNRLAFSPVLDAYLLHVTGSGAAEVLAQVARQAELSLTAVSSRQANAADDQFVLVSGDIDTSDALTDALRKRKLQVEVSRVIRHGTRAPLGLTRELVVRFQGDVHRAEAERLAATMGLSIMRELAHAGNAFVLARDGLPTYDLVRAADALAATGRVVYVEPNLTFVAEPDIYTPNDTLWGQLPHLGLVDVDDGWDLLDNVNVNLRGGSPAMTIGVIDLNGVAPDHPELTANLTDATSKLVASINFVAAPIAAQTVVGLSGDHGTQCAGSATAAFDNNRGIAGAAPNCHLIGARIGGATNSVLMADIYLWVGGFLNGNTTAGFPALPTRAADVISSSWGSTGLALSSTIRDCFNFLTTYGRQGKGCVLCFSLGNSGYVDFTNAAGGAFRAWPTYERTIAVGSSINTNPTNPVPVSFFPDENGNANNVVTAVDRRTLYSPFGATALRKPDLVSPSHTAYDGAGNLVDPILACVRVGTGAVDGCPGVAVCSDYANSFGGTSHSTPTVAGAIALLLSARPGLNWIQVRDILRRSCARIDAAQANAIGQWLDLDGDGLIDYSRWYGAGRLDIDAALTLALDPALLLADVYVRENLTDTGAVPSTGSWWASPDIWVRQDAATPIPALAWGAAPPHENAKRGQNNALFCRVRNRGTAPASSVYVRALLTHWAGLEFVYPADFEPSTNVGAPIPNPLVPGTYLIGETRIDNLGVGVDQIVKFTWPTNLMPPDTVIINGAQVRWHPCLLLEASPHDGPNPVGGLAVPVEGNNNIAQRNIAIDDSDDADSDMMIGMMAGTRADVGVATLILDATRFRGEASIRLHLADDRLNQAFIAAGLRAGRDWHRPPRTSARTTCGVVVEQRTRLRVACGACEVVIEAAPGSRILSSCGGDDDGPSTAWVKHEGLEVLEIRGLRGRVELPLRLAGGEFAPLLVAVVGGGAGDLHVSQRRGDGVVSAGYGVRR